MGLFKRLFGLETRADTVPELTPEVSAELLYALVGSVDMNAEKALEIPAFSMAVDFIANTVAMLPVKLFREVPNEKTTEEITEDERLFLLNDEANPIMGAAASRAAQIRDMLIHGSSFLYIDRDWRGRVRSLRYVKKSDVSVVSNADPIFRDFNILIGGRTFPPFNFVILARNSTDGVTGTGAVDEHKTLLSAMYSTMKYEAMIAKTGGSKKGFLQSERKLTKEAMTELMEAWRNLYANSDNNMMVLNDGVKYNPAAATSVEMQLNENKRTNSEQIAAIFGLSLAVLSGSCTTEQYMSAIRTAVLPIVAKYQEVLNKSLLTEDEKGRYYFVLDTTELLKGDTLSRYQAYEIALRNNILLPDEVRYLEDRKPLGFDFLKLGLNDVLFDTNTKTIYTPNTNALTKMGQNPALTTGEIRDIIELRKKTNWVKGDKGRFAGSVPMGGGGNLGLTNMTESDIIEKDRECVIQDNKIYKFLLLPDAKHSSEFFDVGYTINDGERLRKDIMHQFNYKNAVDSVLVDGKEKFSIFMKLGVTKMRRFRTVWEKNGSDGVPRLITAHRE